MVVHVNLGCDPEIHVINKAGNIVPSHKIITTDKPRYFSRYYEGGSVAGLKFKWIRDGAAVELNTTTDMCRDYYVPMMFYALKNMHNRAKSANSNYRLSLAATSRITKTAVNGAPDDVMTFGCSPDYDAYTLEEKQPMLPDGHQYRYAGGHMHFSQNSMKLLESGYDDGRFLEKWGSLAILMDATIGLASVGILGEKYAENERQRRQFYGQAGSFRPQTYQNASALYVLPGFEYRVLSSRGFMQHPVLTSMWQGIGKQMFTKNRNLSPSDSVGLVKNVVDLETLRGVIDECDYGWVQNNIGSIMSSLTDSYEGEMAVSMVAAAQKGYYFGDNVAYNWGFSHPKFAAQDHRYWQVKKAFDGRLGMSILPHSEHMKQPSSTFHVAQHPQTSIADSWGRGYSVPDRW